MQALSLWSQQLMFSLSRLFIVTTAILATASCVTEPMPDIAQGKATFNTMCSVCHSVQKTGGAIEGPNLIGVVGRDAASQPDFIAKYSTALKASKLHWNKETLDKFLVSPMAMVPGTYMPMLIPDDKTRAEVVAYLASLEQQP
jgi:cytochrome c